MQKWWHSNESIASTKVSPIRTQSLPKASEKKKYIFEARSSSTLRAHISQTIKDINTKFGMQTYNI
jgi:hypothetical protein